MEYGCSICECHLDCEECQIAVFGDGQVPFDLCDCQNRDGTITCFCRKIGE